MLNLKESQVSLISARMSEDDSYGTNQVRKLNQVFGVTKMRVSRGIDVVLDLNLSISSILD